MFVLEIFEAKDALVVDRREAAVGHGMEQFVFRPEVVIDRGQVDPGEQGDLAQRHAVESAGGVNAFGGFEDAFARRIGGVFFRHTFQTLN